MAAKHEGHKVMGVKVGPVMLCDLWTRLPSGLYLGKFVPCGFGDQSGLIDGLPQDLLRQVRRLRAAEIGVERGPSGRWIATVWLLPGSEVMKHSGMRTLAQARERGCHLLLLGLGLAKIVPASD